MATVKKYLFLLWALAGFCMVTASYAQQSVVLAGMLGQKALLVVDGQAPQWVAVGQTHLNVKVISASANQALLEFHGQRQTLQVGAAPLNVGAFTSGSGETGRSNKIVLTESSGGHFMTQGQINGRAVQLMVDTGATMVSMGAADADRIGLNYRKGEPVRMSTANGVTQGFRLQLRSVRIAEVEIFEVDAVVSPESMPYILLGNSFLSRFQMKRENNQMTLEKRF